jgi:hypothetical protein
VFAGADGHAFLRRWLDSIYLHCHFIAGHFSKYSSANNHLFGEYMGLFIGALTWPCWNESARWLETAQAGLEQEALRQNGPDGVNREQAIWYQHEVADMMLLCGLAGKANGVAFPAAWWSRLETMLEFIAALMDVGGRVPMIGDSDDAVMVRFSREPIQCLSFVAATGRCCSERARISRKAGAFDDKSRWLLGRWGREFVRLAALSLSGGLTKRAFPEGGYYILGDRFDTPDEVRIVADAGPLGYLSIAAHGHADALAFTLSAGGREILIDPGTYAYHTQKKWRDYFRGTSAHNTVRVDGLDQSMIGGNFMWLKHARAWCEQWESDAGRDFFAGAHDGYRHCRTRCCTAHARIRQGGARVAGGGYAGMQGGTPSRAFLAFCGNLPDSGQRQRDFGTVRWPLGAFGDARGRLAAQGGFGAGNAAARLGFTSF